MNKVTLALTSIFVALAFFATTASAVNFAPRKFRAKPFKFSSSFQRSRSKLKHRYNFKARKAAMFQKFKYAGRRSGFDSIQPRTKNRFLAAHKLRTEERKHTFQGNSAKFTPNRRTSFSGSYFSNHSLLRRFVPSKAPVPVRKW